LAESNLTGEVLAPPALRRAVEEESASWTSGERTGRLWQRDPTVWTGGDEGRWLGWLDLPDPDGPEVRRLDSFVRQVRRDGVVSAALLGMGGSSLCPEMLQRIFGSADGVRLRVLDSTDPAQVRAFESTLDIERTLFVVSSKSGTTLETSLLQAYFFERVRERAGDEAAGSRFVAVTDPGSALDRLAIARGFRAVFHGEASIGGRYSALSYFGLLPAALIGVDVRRLLARATSMTHACGAESPASENPGVQLGLLLGLTARAGRDKATLVNSPVLDGFGAWVEQLLAESTGKDGRGIMPVDGELLGDASVYGDDRVFVATMLDDESDEGREEALDALARAGHPVVRFRVRDRYDIGAECFRWEFATAVAGAVLRLHPFDQPDVEASKVATRAITGRGAAGGREAPATPVAQAAYDAGVISAYVARPYSTALRRSVGAEAPVQEWVTAHMRRLRPRGYFAVLAYLEMCAPHLRVLDELRHRVRASTRVATTVGFGPRFLHSTGQAHKGGSADGLFLVITCAHIADVRVPHEELTFGAVEDAQAAGDCAVLASRRRRWLRLHIDGDVESGLATISSLVSNALAAGVRPRRGPRSR
jgi:transaldolase/glucose-6-phosphate isomerase